MSFDPKGAAADFFEFLGRHGVQWFFVEAQSRKLNGERGAPLGQFFKSALAWHFKRCALEFERLSARLEKAGKKRVDLQTRESPAFSGARLLHIDDLQEHFLNELLHWWSGPMVIMETSPHNFQALLVSPRALQKDKLGLCLKALANKFVGDKKAASVGQLHRFPGSPNFKARVVIDGQPFFCRTLLLQDGEADGMLELQELLAELPLPLTPTPAKSAKAHAGGVAAGAGGNSEKAFRWAVNQLKADVANDTILRGLTVNYLSHHDLADWPKRTLHNARHALGMESERYHSSTKTKTA